MSRATEKPRIVVLGGGNGASRLLRAMVPMLDQGEIESLHALVLNADDGGSSGRLREQYDVSAMGDLTRCLMALSGFHGDRRGEQFLKALNHRFDSGDFKGHSLRHIFLTSLELTSDIDAGIAMMARILQVPKKAGVVPLTLTPLTQQVEVAVGETKNVLGQGQHSISHTVNMQADPRWQAGDVRVSFAEQSGGLNPRAKEVLEEATHIMVAPGHTYGTILPALALPELGQVVGSSQAKLSVVMSLLTTPRQTTGWSGDDFVKVYESYLGKAADVVIGNSGSTDIELVEGQDWVRFDERERDYKLIEEELVSREKTDTPAGDVVPRAIVVHDSEKLAKIFRELLAA